MFSWHLWSSLKQSFPFLCGASGVSELLSESSDGFFKALLQDSHVQLYTDDIVLVWASIYFLIKRWINFCSEMFSLSIKGCGGLVIVLK